jgi:hypothetical protein
VLSSVPWAFGGEREGGGERERRRTTEGDIHRRQENTIIVTHTHTNKHYCLYINTFQSFYSKKKRREHPDAGCPTEATPNTQISCIVVIFSYASSYTKTV